MRNIIKDGLPVDDRWLLLRPGEDGTLPPHDAGADVIVPLAYWLAGGGQRTGRTAVWLAPDDDPARLAGHLDGLTLIAVDFPAFTDGRGYSLARLLRERYSYAGELRAVGDIWHDHLQALWQVGFDTFEIKPGKPLDPCRTALQRFSEHYQSNYRQPLPLFRRSITNG